MRLHPRSSAQKTWLITSVLATLLLLIPVGATAAYLTTTDTASKTSAGVGRWCAVPDPTKNANAYRLRSFPEQNWGGTESSQIIIVPVVRDSDFGASGGDGGLGVRAWTCSSESVTNSSSVKVTAWRNTNPNAKMSWLPSVNGKKFASQRLDPNSELGKELTKLHRNGTQWGDLKGNDRQRYSWMMSSGRTTTSPNAAPPYSSNTYKITPEPTFASAFMPDQPDSRQPSNSVTYFASAYWTGAGTWPSSSPTAHPVKLDPYKGPQPPFANNQGPTSTDGRQVEWVVMEWWGKQRPSDDMILEVFVQ